MFSSANLNLIRLKLGLVIDIKHGIKLLFSSVSSTFVVKK